MERLTAEHPLFLLLRKEHDEILNKISQMKNTEIFYQDLKWLWEYGELWHHLREEKILFNYLLANKLTEGGGPLCMFFMDQYILDPPQDRAKAVTGRLPPIEEHLKPIFDSGSVMRIPVNDHIAGKDILCYMLENFEKKSPQELKQIFQVYTSIQTANIQKEETCFYFMCANILTKEEADRLFAELNRLYDRGHTASQP